MSDLSADKVLRVSDWASEKDASVALGGMALWNLLLCDLTGRVFIEDGIGDLV